MAVPEYVVAAAVLEDAVAVLGDVVALPEDVVAAAVLEDVVAAVVLEDVVAVAERVGPEVACSYYSGTAHLPLG